MEQRGQDYPGKLSDALPRLQFDEERSIIRCGEIGMIKKNLKDFFSSDFGTITILTVGAILTSKGLPERLLALSAPKAIFLFSLFMSVGLAIHSASVKSKEKQDVYNNLSYGFACITVLLGIYELFA